MGLLALDIMSHFAHLQSTYMKGQKSHKTTGDSTFVLLRYYYGSRPILFILCFGQEACFLLLYFLKMAPTVAAPAQLMLAAQYAYWVSLPLCAIKTLMNLIQLFQACYDIGQVDLQEHTPKVATD